MNSLNEYQWIIAIMEHIHYGICSAEYIHIWGAVHYIIQVCVMLGNIILCCPVTGLHKL